MIHQQSHKEFTNDCIDFLQYVNDNVIPPPFFQTTLYPRSSSTKLNKFLQTIIRHPNPSLLPLPHPPSSNLPPSNPSFVTKNNPSLKRYSRLKKQKSKLQRSSSVLKQIHLTFSNKKKKFVKDEEMEQEICWRESFSPTLETKFNIYKKRRVGKEREFCGEQGGIGLGLGLEMMGVSGSLRTSMEASSSGIADKMASTISVIRELTGRRYQESKYNSSNLLAPGKKGKSKEKEAEKEKERREEIERLKLKEFKYTGEDFKLNTLPAALVKKESSSNRARMIKKIRQIEEKEKEGGGAGKKREEREKERPRRFHSQQ